MLRTLIFTGIWYRPALIKPLKKEQPEISARCCSAKRDFKSGSRFASIEQINLKKTIMIAKSTRCHHLFPLLKSVIIHIPSGFIDAFILMIILVTRPSVNRSRKKFIITMSKCFDGMDSSVPAINFTFGWLWVFSLANSIIREEDSTYQTLQEGCFCNSSKSNQPVPPPRIKT